MKNNENTVKYSTMKMFYIQCQICTSGIPSFTSKFRYKLRKSFNYNSEFRPEGIYPVAENLDSVVINFLSFRPHFVRPWIVCHISAYPITCSPIYRFNEISFTQVWCSHQTGVGRPLAICLHYFAETSREIMNTKWTCYKEYPSKSPNLTHSPCFGKASKLFTWVLRF